MLRLPGTYPAQGDTRLLIDTLRERRLAPARRVLDLGTGGGALALAAAAEGAATVTAVDLSRRSVTTARLNSLLHRAHLEVRRGDLFAPVAGRRFDLVLANPPYVPAATDALPRHRAARSWDAGLDGRAVLDRICAGVPAVLADEGVLLVTQSVLAGEEATLRSLRAAGLTAEVVARRPEPFGPVMRRRVALLRDRGLLTPEADHEELVVIEARARPVRLPDTAARTDSVRGRDVREQPQDDRARRAGAPRRQTRAR
nr:HemK2/MTQ2 family protein methyltransferase [Kineococcus siccus]